MISKLLAKIAAVCIATTSFAEVCDYRPSELIGVAGTTAIAAGGTSVATIGVAGSATGFYTLTHAVTGATMLGSTLGGASAAGTVGIMGGTAGAIGTTAAILLAPVTVITAATLTGGILGFEGVCYYVVDDSVTGEVEILTILEKLKNQSLPGTIKLNETSKGWMIGLTHEPIGSARHDPQWSYYNLKNLYVHKKHLMSSDWGRDTVLREIDLNSTKT